jgi:hypothetical protein
MSPPPAALLVLDLLEYEYVRSCVELGYDHVWRRSIRNESLAKRQLSTD